MRRSAQRERRNRMSRNIDRYLKNRDIIADLGREIVRNSKDVDGLYYFEKDDGEYIRIEYSDGAYNWAEIGPKGLTIVRDIPSIRMLNAEHDWEVF